MLLSFKVLVTLRSSNLLCACSSVFAWSCEILFARESFEDWWWRFVTAYTPKRAPSGVQSQHLLNWFEDLYDLRRSARLEVSSVPEADVRNVIRNLEPLLSGLTGDNIWGTVLQNVMNGFQLFRDPEVNRNLVMAQQLVHAAKQCIPAICQQIRNLPSVAQQYLPNAQRRIVDKNIAYESCSSLLIHCCDNSMSVC